ncbi:hypothetical protein L7F22_047166 [Adiantum nelumboides]|nr:hypothetical protein [Adiantum nelumboides]
MLRRKKRRIAHGADGAGDMVIDSIDEKPSEARYSVFTKMQSKWGKIIEIPGGFHTCTGRKREAPRRVLSRRLPAIKLRVRMLLKKMKDKCGKFFSSKTFCKKENGDGHGICTENVRYATPPLPASALASAVWGSAFQSPSNKPHPQLLQPNGHANRHQPHCQYPIFSSLAEADAIAECIEFIKRSTSTSSSSSLLSASSSSSMLT